MSHKDNKNDCKHCKEDDIFPSIASSLRASFKTSKLVLLYNKLRRNQDEGFKEMQDKEYCCDEAKYDAEEVYDKYFPYDGMQRIINDIVRIECISQDMQEIMKDITIEEFISLDCDSKINHNINDLQYYIKTVEELISNVQKALKRETDPKKRILLDGRKI